MGRRTTVAVAAMRDLICATTGQVAETSGLTLEGANYALRCLERRGVVVRVGKARVKDVGRKQDVWRVATVERRA